MQSKLLLSLSKLVTIIVAAAAPHLLRAQAAPTSKAATAAAPVAPSKWPAPIEPAKPFVPAGFTALFNGENLTGWHVSTTNHHGTTPDYHVMHGMIVATQSPLGRGGILLTDKKYKNIEIYMEVKPDYGCDSGLFLRSSEAGEAYQVTLDYLLGGAMGTIYGERLDGVGGLDNAVPGRNNQRGAAGSNRSSGAGASANPAAGKRSANATPPIVGGIPLGSTIPQGEDPWMKVWKREDWNKVHVRLAGDIPHITVWLNDQLMTDFTDTANHAKDGITEGPIAIQMHGGMRWVPGGLWRWRTIAVKELAGDAK